MHQQMCANAVRERLEARSCEVTVASWFSLDKEFAREGDTHITGEDSFSELISRGFDVIIADSFFRRAARGFKGEWIDLPHFGTSGRCPDGAGRVSTRKLVYNGVEISAPSRKEQKP